MSRQGVRLLILVVIVTIGLIGLIASGARAHASLVSTSPEPGATVEAPQTLTLTFSEELIALGADAQLTGSDGAVAVSPTVSGRDLVVTVSDQLPPGDYDLAWRVTSADGHPISDTLNFTVAGAASPETTAAPDGTETATDETNGAATGTATSGTGEETQTDQASQAGEAAGDQESSGSVLGNPGLWMAVALVTAGLGFAAWVWRGSRGREDRHG